ncbi:Wzz/FepE/Etk N-terminal domain-containing protein [Litchfieldella xinjiangensis]|uniref:Wzz/FepE/Etk N-terminal domain-containing protein n=1 Tax=Litchfieldella xinjiangensis TaxID=1166948 RepID=UPI0005BBEF32|nr:Wzz/FepE/Etk N-terminal domain-containing protein [Halomonas xinjiangensis]
MTQPPSHTTPAHRPDYSDDEISLVDLAKILVRRWKAMAVIFILVVGAALAYALMMPRTYQYVSIYNAAESEPGVPLEAPTALVAKARNLYLGPLTREMYAEQGWESLPFEVNVSNPEDTLLISISSEAEESDAGEVETLHQRLVEQISQGQQRLVERRRGTLEQQLERNRQALDAVQGSESASAAELIATYTTRISEIEADLADLTEGEISQVAVQSLQPTGTSRKLVLALGIVLGGMLAMIGVFLLQFATLVRSSLKEDR